MVMAILFIFIALNLIRARVENVSPENDRSAKENVGCAKGDLRSRSRYFYWQEPLKRTA